MRDGPETGRVAGRVCGLSSSNDPRWRFEEFEEMLLVAEIGDGAAATVLSGKAEALSW